VRGLERGLVCSLHYGSLKIARVFLRLGHVAGRIVNANHGII
jgi:hypothetical protein